jgi:hypothetical protein
VGFLSTGFLLLGARESTSATAQHLCPFFESHVDLIANGNKTLCQVKIVLANQIHGDKDVVNVTEYQRAFLGVLVNLLDK